MENLVLGNQKKNFESQKLVQNERKKQNHSLR